MVFLALALCLQVHPVRAASYTWGGGSGLWFTSTNWSPFGVPGASDSVTINSGTVTVVSNEFVANLAFNGGILLNGTGTLTVNNTMNWFGGSLSGAGGRVVIAPSATLNINNTTNTVALIGCTLQIKGSALWSGSGSWILNSSAVVTNSGLFEIQNNALLNCSTSLSVRIDNAGTFRKRGATGTTIINPSVLPPIVFNNYGTLGLYNGILDFRNAAFVPMSGSTIEVALGGTAVGSGYGRLLIRTNLVLDGGLSVFLTNSFVPSHGSTFTIITNVAQSGAFTSTNGLNLSNGKSLTVNYLSSAVRLDAQDTAPSISVQPQSQLAPVGGDVTFDAVAAGTSPLNFTWYKDGIAIPDNTNATYFSYATNGNTGITLIITNVQEADAGNYVLVLDNAAGAATSAVATLSLILPNSFLAMSLVGQNVQMTFATHPGVTYTVEYKDDLLAGNWTMLNATLANGINITVTDQAGAISRYYRVRTETTPPVYSSNMVGYRNFILKPGFTTLYNPFNYGNNAINNVIPNPPGESFVFKGNEQAVYEFGQWLDNLTFDPSSMTLNPGQYFDFYNPLGVPLNLTFLGEVPAQPLPPLLLSQPQPQGVAQGTNAIFTVTASGDLPLSFFWHKDGSLITDATNASLFLSNVQGTDAGDYSVVVTNIAGAITSHVAALVVFVYPNIQSFQLVNQNLQLTFTRQANVGYDVEFADSRYGPWQTYTAITPSATQGVVTVTVTDAQFFSFRFFRIHSGAGLYSSNMVGFLNVLVDSNGSTTLYNPFIQGSNTISEVISDAPDGSAVIKDINNQAVFFTGSGWLDAFNSNPSTLALNTGELFYFANGASVPFTLTLAGEVPPAEQILPPLILTQPQSVITAAGSTVTYSLEVYGTPPYAFQWLKDTNPIPGATGASLMLSNVQGADVGIYFVTVTNAAGAVTSENYAYLRLFPLVAWGDVFNSYGETTIPPSLTNVIRIAAGLYHSLALKRDGTVVAWGKNVEGQTDVPSGLTNVADIKGGYLHSLALLQDGTVVAWGDNSAGQTNVPASVFDVKAIAAGVYHNLVLRQDGTVDGWGDNSMGQLNMPTGMVRIVAIAAGSYQSLALKADGTVVAWGSFYDNAAISPAYVPNDLTNVIAIAAGGDHLLALRDDGTVVAWGNNTSGQTNVPVTLSNVVAIAGGAAHSLALKANNTLAIWGDHSNGQGPLTAMGFVTAIAAGSYYNLALENNGRPAITVQPVDRYTMVGAPVSFTVRAAGNPPVNCQWRFNTEPIGGATNLTLTLSNPQQFDQGDYDVILDNAFGSVTSQVAVLTVTPAPVSYTWNGGSGDWGNSANWTPNGVPGLIDAATVNGGAVTLSTGRSVASFTFTGGSLGGIGALTVKSLMNWTGGTLIDGFLSIGTNAVMNVSGAANKPMYRFLLSNYGTIVWSGGGNLQGFHTAEIRNYGVLELHNDQSIEYIGGVSRPILNNPGIIRKIGATSVTTNQFTFNSSGLVDMQSGSLEIQNGGSIANGSSFTGAGVTRLAGGTYSVNGAINSENLELASSVSWTGAATLTGLLTWTGGAMIDGSLKLATNGGMNILGSANKTLLRFALTNAGTLVWSGAGNLQGFDTAKINNAGLFEIQNDQTLQNTGGTTAPALNNTGTLRKTGGAGATSVEFTWTNSGNVDTQTGGLVFVNGATINNGSTFTGAGITRLSGVTYTVNGAINSENLELASTASWTGAATLTGVLNWTGGFMNGAGGLGLATNGALNIIGPANKVLTLGYAITNWGTINWSGAGNLRFDYGALIQNNGLFEIQNNQAFNYTGGAVATFNNTGIFRKSAGIGTNVLQTTFNNNGLVEIQHGVMAIASSSFVPAPGSTLRIALGGPALGTQYSQLQASGALNLNGALEVMLTNNFVPSHGNAFQVITAGTRSGAFASTNGVDLGNGKKLVLGYQPASVLLTAQDTAPAISVQPQGQSVSSAALVTLSVTANGTPPLVYQWRKGGSLLTDATNSSLLFNSAQVPDSGNYDVIVANAAGSVTSQVAVLTVQPISFVWNGSTGDWTDSASWTPNGVPGPFDTTTINSGNVAVSDNRAVANLTLTGGTLYGNATLTVSGLMTWTGGTMSGSGRTIIASGATLNVSNSSAITLSFRTLENAGTVDWNGSGVISLDYGAVVTNRAGALFVAQSDAALQWTGFGGLSRLDNTGIFRKTGGTNTTTLSLPFNNYGTNAVQSGTLLCNDVFNNSGAVTVAAGAIHRVANGGLASGSFNAASGGLVDFSWGSYNLNGSVQLTGAGLHRISGGAVSVDGEANAQNLDLSGGTLTGNSNLTVNGTMIWTAGTMNGLGRTIIASGATLNVSNSSAITLNFRTLENAGIVDWNGRNGSAFFDTDYGAVVTNRVGALFVAQSDTSMRWTGFGGLSRLDNAGIFRKATGTGTTTLSLPFNNYGTNAVQSGTLLCNDVFNNSGAVTVAAGAIHRVANGGLASGSFNAASGGLVDFSWGSYNLNGSVQLTGAGLHRISGGTVSVDGEANAQNLDLSGGTLMGNSNLTVNGTMTWTGGAMSGSGRTIIASGATLNVSNSSAITLNFRTLENAGTVDWNGRNGSAFFDTDYGAVVTNRVGALFVAQSDTSMRWTGFGGLSRLDNAGIFRKTSSSGTTTLGLPFNNYGTVSILKGIVAFNNGFSTTSSSVFEFGLGGTAAGTGFGQVQVSGSLTLAGTLNVNLTGNYFPNLNDRFAVLTFASSTGSFSSTNGLTFDGGGRFAVNATPTMYELVVTSQPTCAKPTPSFVSWWPADGTANSLIGTNHGTLQNGATFAAGQVAQAFSFDGVDDRIALGTNSSLRQPSAATYMFWAQIPPGGGGDVMGAGGQLGHGLGGIQLRTNALLFRWTPRSPQDDAYIAADGITLPSDQWIHLTISVDFVNQTRAMYVDGQPVSTTLANSIAQPILDWVPQASYSSGLPDFIGGRYVNSFQPFRGLLDEVAVYNRALSAAEILMIYNAGSLGQCQDSPFINAPLTLPGGIVDAAYSQALEGALGTPPYSFTVTGGILPEGLALATNGMLNGAPITAGTNNLTIRVTDALGASSEAVFSLVISPRPPASFVWNGGTGDWTNAANWTPNGVPGLFDTATINSGNVAVSDNRAVANLTLTGGTLSGTGTLSVSNVMNWTGGTMNTSGGRTLIASDAALNLTNSANVILDARVLENAGMVVWTGSAIFTCQNGAVVTNRASGLFEVRNDQTFNGGSGAHFDNAGNFRKAAGTGMTAFSANFPFHNYGTVEVLMGTLGFGDQFNQSNAGLATVPSGKVLWLAGGGSSSGTFNNQSGGRVEWTGGGYSLNSGAQLNGTGIYTNSATVTVNADVAVQNLDLRGTISGPGTLTISNVMNWTGGTMNGAGRTLIASGAALNLANSVSDILDARMLENAGTVVWTGSAIFTCQNGAVVTNRASGLFEVRNDQTFNGGSGAHFENAGNFRKAAGTGTTAFSANFPFHNYGTVEVRIGTLGFGDAFTTTSASAFVFGLGGTTAGTGFGQLQVSGTLNLNGAFNVVLTNGFVPAHGNTFQVITAGTRSGSFSSTNGVNLGNGKTLVVAYLPTSVVLTAQATGPSFTLQPQDIQVSAGESVSFQATATGTTPLVYQWQMGRTDPGGGAALAVMNTQPILYYRFSETSGTTTPNLASNLYAGAYSGVTLGLDGPKPPAYLGFESDNRAPQFNGSSSYVTAGAPLMSGLAAFSMAGWIRPTASQAARAGLFGQNDAIEFGFIDAATIQIWTPSGGSLNVAYPFPINEWHHLTVVGNGTDLRIYYDGTLGGTGGSATTSYGSSSFNFNIGGNGIIDATGNFFNGQIDEVAVWRRALSQVEITALYQGASAPAAVDLTNNAHIAGATTDTLTLTNVQSSDLGGYRVVVTNEAGSIISLAAKLRLWPLVAWGGEIFINATTIPRGITNPIAIASGYYHNLALKADGTVAAWGDNSSGQSTPPADLTNAVSVSGAGWFSLALRGDGTVVAWGDNTYGQTNVPIAATNVIAISAGRGGQHALALRRDGTVVGWGNAGYGAITIPFGLNNVVAIGAGASHSLALKADGTVVAWGANNAGQLQVPPNLSNVIAIAACHDHNLALKKDGTVVAWGWNGDGQTNVPASATNVIAIAGGYNHSLALRSDGTLVAWGDNTYGQTNVSLPLTNVIAIGAGQGHNLVLENDGRPNLLVQPWTKTAPFSGAVTLDARAAGNPAPTYQWRHFGFTLPGATNATLTLNNLRFTDMGTYDVVVNNASGSVTSGPVVLNLNNLPPVIVEQPESRLVFVAGSAGFKVNASGDLPLAYQWYFNGAPIPGATSPVIRTDNVKLSDAGSYAVIITNNYGSVTSSLAKLVVLAECVPMTNGVVAWWEAESNALDTAFSNHGFLTNGAAFAPGKRGEAFSLDGVDDYVVMPARPSLSITGAISIEAWINPSESDTNFYFGIVSKFNSSLNRASWIFETHKGGFNFYLNEGGAAGSNLRTARTDEGLIPANAWTHAVATFDPASQAMRIFVNGVEVAVTLAGAPAIAGLFDSPEPVTIGAYTDASGKATNFFGGRLDEITLYNRALTAKEVLELYRADFAGKCNPPRIAVQPDPVEVKPGSNAVFSVTAVGIPPLQYQWRHNGVPVPDATNAVLAIASVAFADAGNYSAVVFDQAGSTLTRSVALRLSIPDLPFNDNFTNSYTTNITLLNLSGYGRGSNIGATREVGEPLHAGKRGTDSVWFTLKPRISGIATVSLAGSSFDTLLGVYTRKQLDQLKTVIGDDDSGGFKTSQAAFNVDADEEYNLAIDGFGGAVGNIVLRWQIEPTALRLPEITNSPTDQIIGEGDDVALDLTISLLAGVKWFRNGNEIAETKLLSLTDVDDSKVGTYYAVVSQNGHDVITTPIVVQYNRIDGRPDARFAARDKFLDSFNPNLSTQHQLAGSRHAPFQRTSGPTRGYVGTQVFNTYGAAAEEGEPIHCGIIGGASQWFTYQAPADGRLIIHTGGSDFDTILAVYYVPGNTPPNAFGELVHITCDNNSYTNNLSFVSLNATADMVYYVAVDGVAGATGVAKINYELTPPPSLTGQPAAQILRQGGTATLNATATGTNLTYQWQINGTNLPTATNATWVLTNAQPANSGNYWLVITNVGGAITSSACALTVLGPLQSRLPVVTNGEFRLVIDNVATDTYLSIQGTTNLVNWFTVWSNTPPAFTYEFTQPAVSNRFFLRAAQGK